LFYAATYLGMEAPALFCEQAIAARITPETFSALSNFAAENGARLLALECHKYLCRNMGDVMAHIRGCTEVSAADMQEVLSEAPLPSVSAPADHADGMAALVGRARRFVPNQLRTDELEFLDEIEFCTEVSAADRQEVLSEAPLANQLRTDELEAALRSEFLALPEEDTLAVVLEHADRAQLIRLVRLPLVPLHSASMKRAIAEKLVSDEELRVCRLFQDEGPFRQSMLQSGEARYRLRMGEANVQAVHAQQGQLRAEEEKHRKRRLSAERGIFHAAPRSTGVYGLTTVEYRPSWQ
jgi:hypothetical protein